MKIKILSFVVLLALAVVPSLTSAQNFTAKELVELLVTLELITPEKAAEARQAVGILDKNSDLKITVVSPNGGENLIVGKKHKILWTSSGFGKDEDFIVSYKKDTGSTFNVPISQAKGGKFEWTVPSTISPGSYKIKVTAGSNITVTDWSDFSFNISAPLSNSKSLIKVISPDGGERYNAGDTVSVRWEAPNAGANDTFYIGYSKLFGVSELPLGVTTGSAYEWKIPDNFESGRYKIYVRFADKQAVSDYSDHWFTVDSKAPSAKTGNNSSASPISIVGQVILTSVRISNDTITARYTNNSGSKVHLLHETTGRIGEALFSKQGDNIEDTSPIAGASIKIGDKVKICLENDYNVCSATVSVTGTLSRLLGKSLLGAIIEAFRR